MRKIIALVIAIILVAVIVAYKAYNKPHRSIDKAESIAISATELFNQFELKESEANSRYLNKVVEVTGIVSEVFKNQDEMPVIVLKTNNDMYGISCTMENKESVQVGTSVTIKGFCLGYLSDVVINNGKVIIK